jgi:DNA helicase IV
MTTAEDLAERWIADRDRLSVAEHAASDREWAFGHVVVDEAQELGPMMWRLLMRRCPSRSMTIVGDLTQTGALGGVSSWAATLRPYVRDRATIETLTVNYRTPAQLMTLAVGVLRAAGVPVAEPTSARSTPWEPVLSAVPDVVAAVPDAVREELDLVGAGTLGVLTPRSLLDPASDALGPDAGRVSVLTVEQAKGLEFDSVLLLEPAAIIADSPRGIHDLYVAITRATQRLHVLHATPLPPGFR